MLDRTNPEAVGLDNTRWQFALDLVDDWCRQGLIPSAGLFVARSDKTTGPHLFGRQQLTDQHASIRDDAIFLIASITKPIVGMGLMLLVERAEIALGDRVTRFIPEFGKNGKNAITIRHLLTHTSGLPDMLANNVELRAANAPLAEFVRCTCEVAPDFSPGRGVQYQSMGFAMLGEIIARVSGVACAEFLRREIFEPLGMHDTALGVPDAWYDGDSPKVARITEIQLPETQNASDSWTWNRRYWRGLGAPWGGLLTTPSDLGQFARMMLGEGTADGARILSPATVRAATRNQLSCMKDVPEADRRCRPWGLGWRLHWPAHSANFGDLLGPDTYGHWGATGTVLWIDPNHDAFAVFLSTLPQEPHGSYLAKLANAVAAAMV